MPPVRAPVGVVEVPTGRFSLLVPSLLIETFSSTSVTSPDLEGLNRLKGAAVTANKDPLSISGSRDAMTMR